MSMHFSAKLRKKTYQGFFILTVLSLAGIPALFKLVIDKSAAVAVVNGYHIDPQEYHRSVMQEEQKLATYRERLGQLPVEVLKNLGINTNAREAALEQLINEKILLSVADQLQLHIDPSYIAQNLQNPRFVYGVLGSLIPPYLFNEGRLDASRLKIFLQRQGMTVKNFDDAVEQVIRQYMVIKLVEGAGVISSADLKEYTAMHYASKTFAITRIPFEAYIQEEKKQTPTEEEIRAYFAKHNASSRRYWSAEKRNGTLWAFKPQQYGFAGRTEKDFDQIFMKDVQNILHAPEAVFTSFAHKNQAVKQNLTGKSLKEEDSKDDNITQKLFLLSSGKKAAFVQNGIGYILELSSIESSSAITLEKIRHQVISDILRERAQEKVRSILEKMEDRDIAKKAFLAGNIQVENLIWNPQEEPHKQLKALEEVGISVDRMRRMFLKGQAFNGSTKQFGYRVELIKVGHADQEAYKKKDSTIVSSLRQEAAQRVIHAFIASLRENATIVMNSSLLKNV